YEIGMAKETHFIAMEFVDGVTLRERLTEGRIDRYEVIDIAIQVGLAIEAAHSASVIHRDIKPENIMIRRDGYVKVLDFGLAKLTENQQNLSQQFGSADDTTITRELCTEPGRLLGTVTYMSPEQARGVPVDLRTDVWSWGVVLYEMLAGDTPF